MDAFNVAAIISAVLALVTSIAGMLFFVGTGRIRKIGLGCVDSKR